MNRQKTENTDATARPKVVSEQARSTAKQRIGMSAAVAAAVYVLAFSVLEMLLPHSILLVAIAVAIGVTAGQQYKRFVDLRAENRAKAKIAV